MSYLYYNFEDNDFCFEVSCSDKLDFIADEMVDNYKGLSFETARQIAKDYELDETADESYMHDYFEEKAREQYEDGKAEEAQERALMNWDRI